MNKHSLIVMHSFFLFCFESKISKVSAQNPHLGVRSFLYILAFARPAHVCLRESQSPYSCIHIYAGVSQPTLMHSCMSVRMHVWVCEQLTFVSDEVSAEDDEEAEQDEDDYSHHASNHGVVHSRGGRHGCGVLRRGLWDGGAREEEVRGGGHFVKIRKRESK